jgi:hypothetical protein
VDVGAGSGIWGTLAARRWPDAEVIGVELRDVPKAEGFTAWHTGDFLHYHEGADLLLGNPPFHGIEATIRHALHLVTDGGQVSFLLPLRLLEGQARARGLWREHPPRWVDVIARRWSFDGSGRSDATAYALYSWRKSWVGEPRIRWLL